MSSDEDTTGLEQMLCFDLYAASRALTAWYRQNLSAFDLTYPQYLALRVLWHRGPTTVRDLGRALDLDSGTLSPLLKRLEHAGHIRRTRGADDERTVEIHLTDAGHDLRTRVDAADLGTKLGCAIDLAPEQIGTLHDLLRRIRATHP